MSEQKNKTSDFEAVIVEKMRELIAYRRDTWDWVASPHTIKDTENRLKELRVIGDEISRLAIELVQRKEDIHANGRFVDSNFKGIELARGYERDIQECLSRDWEAKKKAATDNKFDVIKNATFILGVPGLFVTGVKNGIGNGHIDVNEALVIGFAVSVPTVFHKSLRSLFSKVAKGICSVPTALQTVPASIGNDMRIYYVREVIKEKTNSAQVCFATIAKAINDNTIAVCTRTKAGVRKLFKQRGPNP